MISAQEARKLAQETKEFHRDDFFERHSKFISRLDKAIKDKCKLKNPEYYLRIDIHSGELFTEEDFLFLMKYLSDELKFHTRTERGNFHTFEIWWSDNNNGII